MVVRNLAAIVIIALACTQMAGYLTNRPKLRALGAASCAAPFPKVFCDVAHYEPFATELSLTGRDANGQAFARAISPGFISQLAGPHDRRSVYGTMLSLAPCLPRPLWESAWHYGFSEAGPLRAALDLPSTPTPPALRIKALTRGRDQSWIFSPTSTE
jgi:hypothetical protein